MYGSRTDSKGNAVQGDSSYVAPVAGERVEGNTITSIDLAKDRDGNTVESRAVVEFTQANGSKVRWTLFEATQEWQFDELNRNLKHLATKVMTEEEWYAGLEAGGAPADFVGFINKVKSLIMPRVAGKVFTMKFVYKGIYLGLPKYPNWIALPENADTLSTSAKYDKYEPEQPTDDVDAAVQSAAAAPQADGNVF